MKKSLLFTVALACLGTSAMAQINIVAPSVGPITFDGTTAPANTEWATLGNLTGNGATWANIDQVTAALPAASGIGQTLNTATSYGTHNSGFYVNTAAGTVYSMPTTGPGTMLCAKLVNGVGGGVVSLTVEYDVIATADTLQLPGWCVYYSFTGDLGTWVPIPALTGINTSQHVSHTLDFSGTPWAGGSTLFIVWVDDNGDTATDQYVAMDNVVFTPIGGGELGVTVTPGSTNILACSTLTLHAAVYGGVPSYNIQWMKDSADIVGEVNADLILANIQEDANGSYTVRVMDSAPGNPGFVSTDLNPVVVTVIPNTTTPTLLSAVGTPDLYHVTVSFDKPIAITGPSAIAIQAVPPGTGSLAVSDATVQNGTNVILTTTDPRSKKYEVVVQAGQVTDTCNGSAATGSASILDELKLLAWDGMWRYNQDGVAAPADWNVFAFAAEGTWPEGPGPLDAKSTPRTTIGGLTIGTQLSLTSVNYTGGNLPTYYFRAHVNWPVNADPDQSLLLIRTLFDDFGVVYVNGHEVYRDPTITAANEPFDQYSGGNAVGDAAISAYIPVSAAWFQDGDNVVSVLMKQINNTSSDITMGLEVSTVISNWFVGGPLTVTGVTPPNANLNPCDTLTLTATVQGGTRPWTYQWRRNGAVLQNGGNVSGADTKILVVSNVLPGEDNGNYQLFVSDNVGGSANSAIIPVTVAAQTAPAIVSAVGHTDMHTITVTFDKAVNIASATGADFLVRSVDGTGDLAITGSYVTNGTQVILSSTDAREQKNYDLVVQGSGVTAVCGNTPAQNGALAHLVSQVLIFGLDVNTSWQYNQAGADLGASWMNVGYNDASGQNGWTTGDSLFDGDRAGRTDVNGQTIRTVLNLTNAPGSVAYTNTDIPTYYFRKHFTPPAPLANMTLSCRPFFDDDAIIYINGQEAYRGTNIFATNEMFSAYLQRTAIGTANFAGPYALPKTNVFAGDNLIAVYLKQTSPGSSDITMGLELIANITTYAPAGPRLSITKLNATQARISWTPAEGTLQECTTLPNWGNSAVANGGTININSGHKFYRIFKP